MIEPRIPAANDAVPHRGDVVLRFSNVTLARGARTVLRDVDFAVRAGELVAVLGPSGAGKSTLLAAATGELAPTAGTISVLGETLPLPRGGLFALRQRIGVLLQGSGLLTDLDVFENVAFGLRVQPRAIRKDEAHIKKRVKELLGTLDAARLPLAVDIASIPEHIRGYGHVKEAHLHKAKAREAELLKEWDNPLRVVQAA